MQPTAGNTCHARPCYDREFMDNHLAEQVMRIPAAPSIAAIIATIATMAMLVSAPALGQQSAAECADVEDDRERLECYDRVYAGAAESDASESDTSSSTDVRPAATETERARREARQARREADQARREASQARLEAEQLRREIEQGRREAEGLSRETDRRAEPEAERERGTPEERFGMEKKVLELGGDQMSSTAIGQFDYWNRGQRVELENGQVWEIIDATNLFHKATDPRVTIEKGLFSSFYMRIDGLSKGLKVRRIR